MFGINAGHSIIFFHLIRLAITQLLFYSFLKVRICLIYDLKYQVSFQQLLKCLCKCDWFHVITPKLILIRICLTDF